MNWLRRLRYHPKVDDVVALITILVVAPAVVMACALMMAIFEAWRRWMGQ